MFRRLRVKSDDKPKTPRLSPRNENDATGFRERRRRRDNTEEEGLNLESDMSNENRQMFVSDWSCKLEGPKPPPPPPLIPESSAVYELVSEDEKEDVCPTCLEPYTEENPKITAKCGHTFHLSCIYEWLERSQYCPVCASVMEFEENSS